jgi:hypothetical protein
MPLRLGGRDPARWPWAIRRRGRSLYLQGQVISTYILTSDTKCMYVYMGVNVYMCMCVSVCIASIETISLTWKLTFKLLPELGVLALLCRVLEHYQ